jgi:hypothetical protein
MRGLIAFLSLSLALCAAPAFAQATYPTTAGQRVQGVVPLQCDAAGANCATISATAPQPVVASPSTAATAGASATRTTAVASSLVLKASAGNLYDWRVTSGASAGYVLIYNATAAPADGAVQPFDCIALAANTTIGSGSHVVPERYTTGVVIAFSTTGCFTQTLSATAFIRGRVQ